MLGSHKATSSSQIAAAVRKDPKDSELSQVTHFSVIHTHFPLRLPLSMGGVNWPHYEIKTHSRSAWQ